MTVTADTITDDRIRELLFDSSITVRIANDCRRALGWLSARSRPDVDARVRLVEIINARTKETP